MGFINENTKVSITIIKLIGGIVAIASIVYSFVFSFYGAEKRIAMLEYEVSQLQNDHKLYEQMVTDVSVTKNDVARMKENMALLIRQK